MSNEQGTGKKLGFVNIAVLIFVLLVGAGSALLLKNQTTNNLSQFINWSPKVSSSPITTPDLQQASPTPVTSPTPQLQQQSTNSPEELLYGPSGKKTVQLALYKLSFASGETITVLISNSTPYTFWAIQGPSGGSYCQVLKIEQKRGNTWQETGTCGSAMPDRAFEIPFGSKKEVFSFPNDIGNPNSLPAGTYRLRLDYYESDPLWSQNPLKKSIYSQEFRVF